MKIYVWFIKCLLLLFSIEANARVIKAKPGEGIEFYSGSTKLKEMGSTGFIVNGPSADNAGLRVYDFQGYPNATAGNATLRILQTSANNRNVLALETNIGSSVNFDLITATIDVDGTPSEVFSLRGDGAIRGGATTGSSIVHIFQSGGETTFDVMSAENQDVNFRLVENSVQKWRFINKQGVSDALYITNASSAIVGRSTQAGGWAFGPIGGVGLSSPHEIEGPASGTDFALKLNINKATAYGLTIRSDIAISSGYPMLQVYDENNSQELFTIQSEGRLRAGPSGTGTTDITHVLRTNTGTGADVALVLKSGSSGDSTIIFDENTLSRWWMGHIDGTSSAFTMGTGGAVGSSERFRIFSDGTVHIGVGATTGYHYLLTNYANVNLGGTRIENSNSTSSSAAATFIVNPTDTTSANLLVSFYIGGGNNKSGAIAANGTSAAGFITYSDRRLKENIIDLDSQLDNIMSLRPVEFDYIFGGHQIGFIAQEMELVYPDSVDIPGDTNEMKSIVGWDKTSARIVSAIQELKNEKDFEISILQSQIQCFKTSVNFEAAKACF